MLLRLAYGYSETHIFSKNRVNKSPSQKGLVSIAVISAHKSAASIHSLKLAFTTEIGLPLELAEQDRILFVYLAHFERVVHRTPKTHYGYL